MSTTERRIATVLFADLVGYTTLSESLDPEDLAVLQDRYFALAREAVESQGGSVEKYIGDAVVGAFGVPRAGDEDAVAAVRAGLLLVAGVAGLGGLLGLAPGSLRLRVGVGTGEVVATYADAARTAWRLTGDVVNTAARLQSAAEPGAVLVGAGTHLAVARRFRTRSAGALALKGKAEPVPAWVVTGEAPAPGDDGGGAGPAPTLGREADLAALEAAAAPGGPPAVLVVAPPGVGKTRLAAEFAARRRAAGAAVWTVRVDAGPGSGYGAVALLLRAALAEPVPSGVGPDPGTLAARIAGGPPGPRDALAASHALALLDGVTPDADPADLATSWLAALDACAGPRPSVWVLEDLHLAGPDLRAFLAHAAAAPARGGSTRRFVVGTGRPALLDEGLPWPGGRVHHLEPLAPHAAEALLDALVGSATLPGPVRDGVVAAAGGNPLFAEELVRSWRLAGVLHRDETGAWRFGGDTDVGRLPTTVHAVYLGQLDVLAAGERSVVSVGSVAGRTFPAGAVAALAAGEPEPALDRLVHAGLLAGPASGPLDPDSYTYRHAVLRDVAYTSLARAERAALHERFARWVERSASVAGADEVVGTHLAAAHESAPALRTAPLPDAESLGVEAAGWLARAARRHLAGAPHRAAQLWRRALELLGPDVPVEERTALRLGLAEALRRAGDADAAMDAFAEAAATASAAGAGAGSRGLGDAGRAHDLAVAALGYEDALLAARLPREQRGPRGLALIDTALAAAGPGGRGELLAARGQALVHAGDHSGGTAALADALALARREGDDRLVARVLLARRAAQVGVEHLDDRVAGSAEIVERARRAADLETETEGARLRMVDLLEAGDREGADDARLAASALAERLGRPSHLWYPPMWRAMEALLRGSPEAEGLVELFRAEGERWGYRDVEHVHRAQRLALLGDRGEAVSALPVLAAMRPGMPARWAPLLAWAHAEAGRLDEARRELAVHAESGFASLPADMSWSYLAALCAGAVARVGDRAAAGALLPRLRPWAGRVIVLGSGAVCLGAASYFVGLLAQTVGDETEAEAMLGDAIGRNEALDAAPWATRARDALEGRGPGPAARGTGS